MEAWQGLSSLGQRLALLVPVCAPAGMQHAWCLRQIALLLPGVPVVS